MMLVIMISTGEWELIMRTFLKRGNKGDKMLESKRYFFVLAIASITFLCFMGCSDNASVPKDFKVLERVPGIFPDYRDVTIPLNIAPMNFDLCEQDYKDFVTVVSVEDAENDGYKKIASYSGDKIRFSKSFWKRTLKNNVGKKLVFSCYAKNDSAWLKFSDWTMEIVQDPVDPWISYRKIAPGYEYFSDLALWNRSTETFEERAFFRARLFNERTCINCHSFQNYSSDVFLFHMRLNGGGTIFNVNGELVKRDLQAEGMTAGCSYPAWRPNSLHVAFASCLTMQTFHTKSLDRVDVLDGYSDLYLYDVVKNSLTPVIAPSDETLDTFPTWSPDGKTLYYCSAKNPGFESTRTESNSDPRRLETIKLRENFHYDIKKVTYDESTGKFSEPEIVFAASEQGKSALLPRISPDGKTLMLTMTRYGYFPIWFRDADIWTIDLTTGEARNVEEINSPSEPDSYHSWSSTGRWVVFSSRRDDGSYTRLYFTHCDDSGRFSKPFVLPQRDPSETLDLTRSYNIPEFSFEPVKVDERKLLKVANTLEPEKALLKK